MYLYDMLFVAAKTLELIVIYNFAINWNIYFDNSIALVDFTTMAFSLVILL